MISEEKAREDIRELLEYIKPKESVSSWIMLGFFNQAEEIKSLEKLIEEAADYEKELFEKRQR